MQLPSTSEVYAGLRYAGTAAATVATVGAVLGVLNNDQSAALVADVKQITDGLQEVFGGASKLVVLLFPIAVLWLGKVGVSSASLQKQLQAITSHSDVTINGTISVPKSVADAVPSDKVVATVSAPKPAS